MTNFLQHRNPTAPQSYSAAVLQRSGPTAQRSYSVAVLQRSGPTASRSYSVAVLQHRGPTAQRSYSIAVLQHRGLTAQRSYSAAVLQRSGPTAQRSYSVAVLQRSGLTPSRSFLQNRAQSYKKYSTYANLFAYFSKNPQLLSLSHYSSSIAPALDAGPSSYSAVVLQHRGLTAQRSYSIATISRSSIECPSYAHRMLIECSSYALPDVEGTARRNNPEI